METQGVRAVDGAEALASPPSAGRARPSGRLWELDVLGHVWRFFTSVRLALVLILILAAAVLAGTLLDQAPPSVIADPAGYDQWLERARTKYGFWTDVFNFFQLFNIFHTLWFKLIIGLLTTNIIICSLNRWKGIKTTVFGARVRMSETFFQHARYNASLAAAMPMTTAAERVRRALARSHYRVRTETDGASVAIYADRNRFSRFGTFLSHLSIVLILAGTVVGGVLGFKDPEFIVAEGATREVGMGTALSVKLEHFADEYWLEGPPKDFRSELVIYENGQEVKRGTIRVNSPMSYKGVRFHQAFFGQTAVMKVTDASSAVIFDEAVPLAWQTREGSRPVGSFDLSGENRTVYVIGPTSGENDPLIPAGEMRVEVYRGDTGSLVAAENVSQGTPKAIGDLNVNFVRETRFTGLKVVKDPGVNIIWVASALMVLGLVMLFYFPHRRMWALCKALPDGKAEVRLGMTAQRDVSLTEEFKRLRERVGLALGIRPDGGGTAGGGDDV